MLKQDYLAVNSSTPTLVNYENYGLQEFRKGHFIIKNVNPTQTIYLGDANVTKNGGSLPIVPGAVFELDIRNDDALYCISDSGTFQITVIKIYEEE